METFGQKARAYLYALLVHVVVIASLFIGLLWSRTATPVATPGPVIEAEIVGAAAAPRPQSKPRPSAPKPAPAPEPPKPEPPKPAEAQPPPTVQHNDNQEQEKIAEIAEQKAEQAKKTQEEKHRQQQIELDEQKKRDEAEAKQKTKQAEIQKQLDDLRKEREKAAKQTLLAKEKMKQLDDLQKQQSEPKKAPPADVPEAETAKTGMNGNDTSLLAEYSSAIVKVVTDNWNRPDTAPAGVRCAVHIVQIRGGTVLSANIASPCNADQITQESIKQAVTKAQPLPYKGYESVFQRDITFIFKYDGT
jgi:colicin import membrane protein